MHWGQHLHSHEVPKPPHCSPSLLLLSCCLAPQQGHQKWSCAHPPQLLQLQPGVFSWSTLNSYRKVCLDSEGDVWGHVLLPLCWHSLLGNRWQEQPCLQPFQRHMWSRSSSTQLCTDFRCRTTIGKRWEKAKSLLNLATKPSETHGKVWKTPSITPLVPINRLTLL